MFKNKGFTITELMVVVAIIAVLTGIIVSNLANSKSKSRDAKRVSDITQVQLAMELFFDRCNRYPVLETVTPLPAGWVAAPKLSDTGNGCPSGISLSSFTSKLPTAPNPNEYTYAINDPATPSDYIIQAKLENNTTALQDDIDSISQLVGVNGWTSTNLTGIICTDTSSGWYYCAQPR